MSNRLVLIILALWLGFFTGRASAATHHLDYYASQMTHKPTPVMCIKMPGDLGQTIQTIDTATGQSSFDPTIYLAPETCYALEMLISGKRNYNGANAVLTMEHEAMHIVLNSADEGVVECNAVLRIGSALKIFHANTARMRHFAIEGHLGAPPEYLTDPHCKLTEPGIVPMSKPKKG